MSKENGIFNEEQLSWLSIAGFAGAVGSGTALLSGNTRRVRTARKDLPEQLPLLRIEELALELPVETAPEKKKRVVYHGKFEACKHLSDECEIKEIRRPGGTLVSVQLRHPASGYCDRIVLRDTKENRAKIKAAKKQLMTRFQIEKRMGTHVEQRFQRGSSEELHLED